MRPDRETLGSQSELTVPDDESGARLGRYELLFALAAGGMGKVYAARLVGAHGFDRVVAIKRLQPGSSDVQGFLKEARLGARVTHANVVQTLELDTDERGQPFIVMQLVEGISFAQLLERLEQDGQPLDCDLAAWITAQAAAGLHSAHELTGSDGRPVSLVHRDVSPHNLMLSFDGRVYVTDFGIAKLYDAENATTTGTIRGKFAYMSPEQTRGAAVDRRSDVFSLGVVLYEAIAGVRPFTGASPPDVIVRVVHHDPDPPRAVRPDVPEELSAIAMRALDKRVDHRYPTMAALGDALRAHLRRGAADVDEHALAEVIAQWFPDAKTRLRDRLRVATTSGPALPAPAADRADPADRVAYDPTAKLTETATVRTVTQARKRWTVAFASSAAILAAIALVVGFGARLSTPRRATAGANTQPAMTVVTSASSVAITATPPPATVATAIEPPPVVVATASTPSRRGSGTPTRRSAPARGPTGAPPAPSTSPSAPFRSLE